MEIDGKKYFVSSDLSQSFVLPVVEINRIAKENRHRFLDDTVIELPEGELGFTRSALFVMCMYIEHDKAHVISRQLLREIEAQSDPTKKPVFAMSLEFNFDRFISKQTKAALPPG